MSVDSYTEVTSQSWFSRIGKAFKGILFGLILVAIAFVLIFWNEGRTVKRYKTLKEGGGAVVSLAADQTDHASKDGQLVHITGRAETGQVLTDSDFGVTAQALKLKRRVEMYQWQESSKSEEKKKLGGGTETTTTYSYDKSWSSSLSNSDSFKHPEGHNNPGTMVYSSREFIADTVTLGNFTLSTSLKGMINNYTELAPAEAALPANLQGNGQGNVQRNVQRQGNGFYMGNNPNVPEIGDLRVHFSEVRPTDVSIIAALSGNSFLPYQTKAGGAIELLQLGTVTADAMIAKAQQGNKIFAWVLRGGGFFLMFIGLRLILAPLSVFADVVPLLGRIAGAGTGLIAGLLAAVMSVSTMAIAWLVYRPLIGGILLAIAVGIIVLVIMKLKNATPPPISGAAQTSPPPPPPGA